MKKTLLLFLFITAIVNSQIPNYVPNNGLIAWYPFNGNANDESGNNNNGVVNGAVLSNDRYNNPNSSFLFNQNDIDFGSSLFNSLPFSVSGWIKKEGNGTGFNNFGTIFSTSSVIQGNNGSGVWLILNENLNFQKGPNSDVDFGTVFPNNTDWHHFTITFENSILQNSVKLYFNGILVSTAQNPNLIYSPTQNFKIGRGFDNAVDYSFIGKLDDIGIWNRILTNSEVLNLYNSTLSNNNFDNNTKINIYPNPVNEILNLSNIETIEKLTIYDVTGKNVLEIKDISNHQIDVSSLEKGVYFIDIKTQNGSFKEKFVKN